MVVNFPKYEITLRVYNDHDEVAEEIKNNVPVVLYKYRSWNNELHKRILSEREIWFAHPFDLNDPYDVRPPYNIIGQDIDWERFRQELLLAGKRQEPYLTPEELEDEVNIRMAAAQEDAVKYFTQNRRTYIYERENYNSIGVFSCCLSGLNEPMWAYYGDNHNGFAIGFDTVNLTRQIESGFGFVRYDDTPIDYLILGNNENVMEKEMYQKSTRWSPEEEFRFITLGVGFYRGRVSRFQPSAVREILVGQNTSKEALAEIRGAVDRHLPGTPIFCVQRKIDEYGFEKIPA